MNRDFDEEVPYIHSMQFDMVHTYVYTTQTYITVHTCMYTTQTLKSVCTIKNPSSAMHIKLNTDMVETRDRHSYILLAEKGLAWLFTINIFFFFFFLLRLLYSPTL